MVSLEDLELGIVVVRHHKRNSEIPKQHEVPPSRITAVQNSVDTKEMSGHVKNLAAEARLAIRERIGIQESAPVGTFCGMLDKAGDRSRRESFN